MLIDHEPILTSIISEKKRFKSIKKPCSLSFLLYRFMDNVTLRCFVRYNANKMTVHPVTNPQTEEASFGNLPGIPGAVAEAFERNHPNHAVSKLLLWKKTLGSNACRHFVILLKRENPAFV